MRIGLRDGVGVGDESDAVHLVYSRDNEWVLSSLHSAQSIT